jgi:hypothetical protein
MADAQPFTPALNVVSLRILFSHEHQSPLFWGTFNFDLLDFVYYGYAN